MLSGLRLATFLMVALVGCGDSEECAPMSCGDRAVVSVTAATGQPFAGGEMLVTVRARSSGEILSTARCPLALPLECQYDRRGANYLAVTSYSGALERVDVTAAPHTNAVVSVAVGSIRGEVDLSTRSASEVPTCGCATFALALK